MADNLIAGEFVAPLGGEYLDVVSPTTGAVIGKVGVSSARDVDAAVARAREAFDEWSRSTIKTRAAIMLKFHALMIEHQGERQLCVCQEGGEGLYI